MQSDLRAWVPLASKLQPCFLAHAGISWPGTAIQQQLRPQLLQALYHLQSQSKSQTHCTTPPAALQQRSSRHSGRPI